MLEGLMNNAIGSQIGPIMSVFEKIYAEYYYTFS